MTPEQRNKLLGIVFGFSLAGCIPFLVVFLFVADNGAQVFVYTIFTFIVLFVFVRSAIFRMARRYR
jgi:heme/copper-type cytochrome/quinol oxidase subunit 4